MALSACRFIARAHKRMTIMNFCSQCGARVAFAFPPRRQRPVACAMPAGRSTSPKLVVGCVPEYEGAIVLCRRGIEPRRGYWTVPAGFMENGETLQQAAARRKVAEKKRHRCCSRLLALHRARPCMPTRCMYFRGRMRVQASGPVLKAWKQSSFARRMSGQAPSPAPTSPCAATLRTQPARARTAASPKSPDACSHIHASARAMAKWRADSLLRAGAPSARKLHDLRRHRKLYQVQVHGLRGSVSGGLFPRGSEFPRDRPG